jgi:hypothetical protein
MSISVSSGVKKILFVSAFFASILALSTFVKSPQVKAADPLTWAPPVLTNPTTIQVKNTGAVHYPISMDTSKDYIIKLPTNEPLRGGLSLNGGRNIVLIGGEINIPDQGVNPTISNRRLLKTQNATGTVHIEGILARGADASEGIQLISQDTTIQIQNVRIEHIHARDQVNFTDNHPDLIQVIAGPKELRVDKFTGSSDYQGIFIKPETTYSPAGKVTLKRVNVIGDPTARYLFWTTERVGSITLDQFYSDVPTQHPWGFRKTIMPDVNTYAEPRRATIATDAQGREYATWPSMTGPTITGRVTEGLPPGGDFVPAGVAGFSYVSPGYGAGSASPVPTPIPTPKPTPVPTPIPTPKPSPSPSIKPSPVPTPKPTPIPTPVPTPKPTPIPTPVPTPKPTPTPAASTAPVASPQASASPAVSACSADLNDDGKVNVIDYSILTPLFFSTNPSNPRADINKDGVVNLTDFSIMVAQMKTCK